MMSGQLAAIEVAAPARPTINGLDLLSLTFGKAIAKLAALDEHVETDAAGATAYQLGVSIYVTLAKRW